MGFRISEIFFALAYGVLAVAIASVIFAKFSRRPNLDAFPTIGPNGVLGSWGARFRFLTNCADVVQEGYEKYKSAPFKVAGLYGWIVILSSREHLDELRKAAEDEFSFAAAAKDRLNTSYTFGDEVLSDSYHVAVVRSQLTRNIGTKYSEIRDEVFAAFDEILDVGGNEWKSISTLNVMQKIVCRTTNRIFVGLPLCRNPDWIDLNIRYTVNIFKTGLTIGLFPKFLRPLVGSFFTAVARDTTCGLKLAGPIVEERLSRLQEGGGDTTEKSNDFLSWLIEEAKGPQLTAKALSTRLLVINFATIHTISMSFTHALFYLSANSQYVQPLREEVEAIIKREGWSKAAVGKMYKVDSFLRECQRMEGVFALSLGYKAMKDFTFSDGTVIPKGTIVSAAAHSVHYDEKIYEKAAEFKPFRFAAMGEESEDRGRHQFASIDAEYLPFGHGKHACPGRFFAANLMKTMFAHAITTFDIKFENGTARPRSLHYADFISPDPRAKVMFRRRVY